MKQTFVVDIEYDSQYKILSDYVGRPQCYSNLKVPLPNDAKADVGDTVFFRCNHYWYKGIAAKGFVSELIEGKGNWVDVRFTVMINPEEKPLLSIKELEESLPNINWKDRHCSILLEANDAEIFNDRWEMFLQANNIYRGEKMTYKADKLYDVADATFEEYGDGSLEVDMLFNYSDLLEFCDDEFLDLFDVSYKTDVEFFEKDECMPDEKPYMYDDPAIIWTPKKENPLGKLMITCRGYEFDNGKYIACGVNENNEKQARQCSELLNKNWR